MIKRVKIMKNFIIPVFISCTIVMAGVTGKIAGNIADSKTGEPLIGANVQVNNTILGTATDKNGNFVILNVSPGTHSLRATFIGYSIHIIEDVKVNVDQTTFIKFSMESSVIEGSEIIVMADHEKIQRDATSTVSRVRQDEIDALPIGDFTEALAIQAGVIGSGSNLHVRGGRSNEIAYLIDGMYVQDPLLGGLATDIGNGAIQEMSLLTGTFNAEYGNALSGIVNIVTREGGSNLNGQVEIQSPRYWDSKYSGSTGYIDKNSGGLKSLTENRIRATLSGPLFFKDIRFVLNKHIDHKGSYLPFGYRKSDSEFAKLTYLGLGAIKLNLMLRRNQNAWQNYSHSWKLIPERYYRSRSDSRHIGFTLTHIVSEKLFYDIRYSDFYQESYSGVDKDTADYMRWSNGEYDETVGNGNEFYKNADPPELIEDKTSTRELRADLVWQIGQRNEIKFGIQGKSHVLTLWDVYDPKRDNPYVDDYTEKPNEGSIYIQDKIEFPILVINLGLRYDYVHANAKFREEPLDPDSEVSVKSRSQLSPRLGIAHPITDMTMIHFAYGHFFQLPEFQQFYENKLYDTGVREPIFGQADLDAERTISYEVGLTHRVNSWLKADMTAYYKDVSGLVGTKYYPAFTDEAPDRYVGYTVIVNEDYANMKGFEINLDFGPTQNFRGGLTYSFSVAKGSSSSQMEQYPGSRESTRLYFLRYDKPHVINASGTYKFGKNEGPKIMGLNLIGNTDLSFIFKYGSGYPYTPSGRSVGYAIRNSLRRPSTYSLDVELGKTFQFTTSINCRLFLEIVNATNHKNITYIYSDTGDPDFTLGNYSAEYMEDPSNYGPPRSFRFGLKINF